LVEIYILTSVGQKPTRCHSLVVLALGEGHFIGRPPPTRLRRVRFGFWGFWFSVFGRAAPENMCPAWWQLKIQ